MEKEQYLKTQELARIMDFLAYWEYHVDKEMWMSALWEDKAVGEHLWHKFRDEYRFSLLKSFAFMDSKNKYTLAQLIANMYKDKGGVWR